MSKTRNLFLAIAAAGLLAVGGLATVAAQPGSNDDRREDARDRMEDARDRSEDFRDHFEDRCVEDASELNESEQAQCMRVRGFFLNATHARREGAALHGAIAALERNIGRLEVREEHLELAVESGELNETATARAQEAIAQIEDAQERLIEKLEELQARLAALLEKWQSVRQDISDRRHGDDGDVDDGEHDDSDDGEADDEDDGEVA